MISDETLINEYSILKKPITTISKEYNVGTSTVFRKLKKLGLIKEKSLPEISKDDLYKLYITDNLSIAKISEAYNVSTKYILTKLNNYEIKKDTSDITSSRIKTNLEKYGSENPSSSDIIKNKRKETVKSKYGVDNVFQNEEVKEKIKSTNIEKYGVDNPNKCKNIRDKIKETCIKKYGTETPSQNITTYNYFTTEETARDFLNENFYMKTPMEVACELGYSYRGFLRILSKFNIKDILNFNSYSSKYEDELEEIIKSFGITNIIRNSKKELHGKEIDIYLPDYKLGIEFNGSYWHSEESHNKMYHYEKSNIGKENGIFIYHIFEYEWLDEIKKEKIINQLKNILSKNENKIYARKCRIDLVSPKNKSEFLNENHLQGNDRSSLNLGLYYNDELLSIMTFVKPRFNKKYDWELSRYCSKANTTVVGGASKLFKYFISNYLSYDETILSYSDISKTKGGLYESLGFYLDHISDPNYIWWKNNKEYKSRYQCQMKNEIQIMHENGYLRIYDCGNKVWIYKKK